MEQEQHHAIQPEIYSEATGIDTAHAEPTVSETGTVTEGPVGTEPAEEERRAGDDEQEGTKAQPQRTARGAHEGVHLVDQGSEALWILDGEERFGQRADDAPLGGTKGRALKVFRDEVGLHFREVGV